MELSLSMTVDELYGSSSASWVEEVVFVAARLDFGRRAGPEW
jgi:hypothetical protein